MRGETDGGEDLKAAWNHIRGGNRFGRGRRIYDGSCGGEKRKEEEALGLKFPPRERANFDGKSIARERGWEGLICPDPPSLQRTSVPSPPSPSLPTAALK